MTDSTVENLTDIATAGGLQSGDLFYVLRSGSPDTDYKANASALLDFVEANATAFADESHVHTLSSITDAGALATLSAVGTSQITDNAVIYAKLQNVSATDKILGRATAGSGDVEEITCTATARSLLDDTSVGAMRTTLGLSTVAATGAYSDLSGLPTLGSLAAKSALDLSTADASGTLAASRFPALTGDITNTAGALSTTLANNVVTNAKAAQMGANTIKGNNTGSTANAIDLTFTQTTAMLNGFVGDAGSGGTKGLVPAPSAGDAASGKFLKADGTFAVPAGGGSGDTADSSWFGDGSDGNLTISSGTTTLTRDMYYNNLTLSGSGILNNGGFRIFVKGTLDITAAAVGAITGLAANNGNTGANVTGGTAGATIATTGKTVGMGAGGTAGATATGTGAGTVNAPATAITSLGGLGGGGGNGEKGGNGAGGAQIGGSTSANTMLASLDPRHVTPNPFTILTTIYNSGQGGAGGGGGQGGNGIILFANTINRGSSTASGAISGAGGNGGAGNASGGGNRGGGMGGCGGGGPLIYVIYKTLSGSSKAGAIVSIGGNGGTGGNATGTGAGGYGGATGKGGVIIECQIGGAITVTTGARTVSPSGLAGGTNSGTAGGSGTTGETTSATL